MILIKCPYCGERDQSEFSNGGEAHVIRPKNPESLSDKDWGEYVFYRNNPKGIFYERWVHSHGCKKWFNAVRNTSTDQILKVYKVNEKRPDLSDFENTLKLSILTITNTTNSNLYGLENISFTNLLTSSKISLIIFMVIAKIELISIFLLIKKFLNKS